MTVDTGDKAYENAQDTLYSYLGIMRAMQDVAERQVILGEIRGDLVTPNDLYTTDTLKAIANFDNSSTYLRDRSENSNKSCSMLQISDYYNIINNCNFYIHNADTSAVKSNYKYMMPEYIQVKTIRAWAYLQLVKNYKAVPYITEPVNNLGVIESFDYNKNLVDKDNLIDRLSEDGFNDQLVALFDNYGYPGYGSVADPKGKWNNGAVDISTKLCYIPTRLVLGDLYLLRGNNTSDYEKAATYYYDFLSIRIERSEKKNPLPLQYCTATLRANGTPSYGSAFDSDANMFGAFASTYEYKDGNEVISCIPGSANAGLGKMLTRVADIYGYTTTSSQSSDQSTTTTDGETTTNTDANGNTEYESKGAISVNSTYKRQFSPSEAYNDVVNDQAYAYVKNSSASTLEFAYIKNCDARYGYSVENLTYEGDAYPLCSKAAHDNSFFYTIPIYRKTLVWLRFAEAINRAGYPEFAFAVLKDGLNYFSIPKVADFIDTPVHIDENGDSIAIWNNKHTVILDYVRDTIPYRAIKYATYGRLYYVTDTLQLQSFCNKFDFSGDIWNNTYGIHARGAGYGPVSRTVNNGTVTCISGINDTTYYDYSKLLLNQGVNFNNASKNDIINAVENIIVDELALETAFEGNRFTDLIRIAEHKNASGYNGTEWLAKKIANRGTRKATEESPAIEGYDATLYSKLTNPANWYFPLPQWKK